MIVVILRWAFSGSPVRPPRNITPGRPIHIASARSRAFSSEEKTGSRWKTRQIKNPEPRFDSIETEKALVGSNLLALLLKDLGPVLDQLIQRLLRRSLVGNDVIVHALLHVEQELRVRRLGPEVLHDRHRLQELRSKRCAFREAGGIDDRLQSRIAANFPPFLLYRRLRKPLDVSKRVIL